MSYTIKAKEDLLSAELFDPEKGIVPERAVKAKNGYYIYNDVLGIYEVLIAGDWLVKLKDGTIIVVRKVQFDSLFEVVI